VAHPVNNTQNLNRKSNKKMKRIRKFLVPILAAGILAFAVLPLIFTGCATKLAPGGVYNGDVWLYNIDQTASAAYTFTKTFVTWEMNNRAEIQKVSATITPMADTVRDNAPRWWAETMAARGVYVQAKQILGGTNSVAADSPILIEAKTKFLQKVTDLAGNANDMSAASRSTGLANAPNFKKPLAIPTL
jgi:hypothetical protein